MLSPRRKFRCSRVQSVARVSSTNRKVRAMAAQAASSVRGVGPRAARGGAAARGAAEAWLGQAQPPGLLCPLGTWASILELALPRGPPGSRGAVGTNGALPPSPGVPNLGFLVSKLHGEAEGNLGAEGVGWRPRAARSPRLLAPPGECCLGPADTTSGPGGRQLRRVKAKAGA